MAQILGVHGIAQQYQSGPELTRVWWEALRGGLEAAGSRATADALSPTDVRVAFYADLFRPHGAMAGSLPAFTALDLNAGPERGLLEAWYGAAIMSDPSLGPPEGAMGLGRVTVAVMLERLLRSATFAGMAERAFIGSIKQVTAFLTNAQVKERVLQRIADEVTSETQVMIGHSLGSVVVYEYLASFAPPQITLLITLGSPLGIPNLIFDRLTPAPLGTIGKWPGSVVNWTNIADRRDIVAMRPDLSPLFRPLVGGSPINDRLVHNGQRPHAINRYLNSAPTGESLVGAL